MTEFPQDIRDDHRVAARIIFPANGDGDVLDLYVDRGAEDRAAGRRVHGTDILSKTSIRVPAERRVSLGSYFNAFPAAYWARWTPVKNVRLEVVTSGPGQLIIYRSNARGDERRVDAIELSGSAQRHVVDLPLNTFGDGGWYWFDLVAGDEDLVLEAGAWWVPTLGRAFGSATLTTTTLNKTEFIIENLRKQAADPALLSVIDETLVVDQGRQRVRDADGFADVAAALEGKLDVIEQPNLGGSGGYSRGQLETMLRGKSDYVILLDDDIALEPESLLRMIAFADMCTSPSIVGGHMLDLYNRTMLHTLGEVIDRSTWGPTLPRPNHYYRHDFAKRGLRETRWLHSRVDVEFNGWWCCLIPVRVLEDIGLSLPIFIKWDDSEYGIRAGKAGYPTVSLPGAAIWHISWVDKNDALDWQAYFHNRNRLIMALVHGASAPGIIKSTEINDLKHVVAMQYYAITNRLLAVRDVLAGPDQLPDLLGKRIGEVRAQAANFTDSTFHADREDLPAAPPTFVHGSRPKTMSVHDAIIDADFAADEQRPVSRKRLVVMGLKALARQVKPVNPDADRAPQAALRHVDNNWWTLANFDSALVTNAEGTGVSWYRRDRKQAAELASESVRLNLELLRRWDELAAAYQQAAPQLASPDTWRQIFADAGAPVETEQPDPTSARRGMQ